MSELKSIAEILHSSDKKTELYTSDQVKREKRRQKGYFTSKGNTFDFIHLLKSWKDIVGEMLAKHSLPLKIYKKTLYVSTKHQIFAQEMGFLIPDILDKIYEHFPNLESHISNIKFINNEFLGENLEKRKSALEFQPKAKRKVHPFSPEYLHKKSEAQKIFGDIEDPEIRDILTKYYLS